MDLFLGQGVDNFLEELHLNRQSTELKTWIISVREFYVEATSKLLKYFQPGMESKTLQYLTVLDPRNIDLDEQKKRYINTGLKSLFLYFRWQHLGEKFSNVMNLATILELKQELAKMRFYFIQYSTCPQLFFFLGGYQILRRWSNTQSTSSSPS